MTVDSHGVPEADRPEGYASGHLRLAPRVFWLLVLATLIGACGLVGAAYLSPVFVIPEAFVVAVVADGTVPFTGGWQGWRRRVDRTRVGMFVGWYVVALLGLSLMAFVIHGQIYV
ncbi:MAG: hypothetical protein ACHQ4F_13785 [Candidatus Dormibacteria bacterium]